MSWPLVCGAAFAAIVVSLIVRIFNRRESWAIELGIWLAAATAIMTIIAVLEFILGDRGV